MRSLGWLACFAFIGVAAASPLRPKPPDPKLPVNALRSFLEGMRADRRGNFGAAMSGYSESARLSSQATTYYNLAEVELRAGVRGGVVIEHLKKYLELATPGAADRAAVEQLIAELASTPPELTIGGAVVSAEDREADAIILVDSVVVGRSPVTVRPTVGTHLIERITAHTYAHSSPHAGLGRRDYVDLSTGGSYSGNVLITGMIHHTTWLEGKVKLEAGHRFALPPGTYPLGPGAGLCRSFTFEVKTGVELTYVRVNGPMNANSSCFDVTGIVVLPLRVTPP